MDKMVKKITRTLFYSSHTLGICFAGFIAHYSKVYICVMPILISFIAMIVYIVVYKNKTKVQYIFVHIVIDLIILIMMMYFIYIRIIWKEYKRVKQCFYINKYQVNQHNYHISCLAKLNTLTGTLIFQQKPKRIT